MTDDKYGSMTIDDLLARAVELHRGGHIGEAEEIYRRVLETHPNDPDVLFLAGSVTHGLGKGKRALELLDAAVQARPGFTAALNNAGMVLRAEGRDEDAANKFREALASNEDFAPAWRNLGDALMALGRPAEAIDAYNASISTEPGDAEGYNNLAMALRAQGQGDLAIHNLQRALELNSGFALARYNLCTVLLEAGQPGAVAPLCGPDHLGVRMAGGILACRGVAAAETGDTKTFARLQDFERLIHAEQMTFPSGYADMAAFNEALANHVCQHPTLRWEPDYQSTRRGSVTRNLLVGDNGPMADLEQVVYAAVERYILAITASLSGFEHPLLEARPPQWRLSSWAVVMGREGHQAPHIHPAGWLSSVYYVRLPQAMRTPSSETEGWIEFGRPPENFVCQRTYPTKLFRPEEGLFILFPSYIYHRTIPYNATEPRISIAFDIEPIVSAS